MLHVHVSAVLSAITKVFSLMLIHRSYAWDYRVLKTFSKHYSTGDIIPKELVESMVVAKKMFAATELQRQVCFMGPFLVNSFYKHFFSSTLANLRQESMTYATFSFIQIFYALVDQTLFGEQPSMGRDTMAIVADLKRQHTSWTHVEGTHWHTRFSHLTNYGAGIITL